MHPAAVLASLISPIALVRGGRLRSALWRKESRFCRSLSSASDLLRRIATTTKWASSSRGTCLRAAFPLLLGAVVLTATLPAFAFPISPYVPLSNGTQWSYTKNGVSGYVRTVSGSQWVNGYTTKSVTFSPEGEVDYYSNDATGVKFHGKFSPSVDVTGCGYVTDTVTYSPPVAYANADVTLGQTVTSSGNWTHQYAGCGTALLTYSAQSTIQSIEYVTVPLGTFYAVKVVANISYRYSTGSLYASATRSIWLAEGLGIVKQVSTYSSGGTDIVELVSTNLSAPVTTSTTSTTTSTTTTTTTTTSTTIPASPAVSVSPTSLAFPSVPLGLGVGASGWAVTVKNTGNALLAISSISANGDFAVLGNSCSSSLAAGASCGIGLGFSPSALGARTGTLTIVDSAVGSPHTVPLSGTGIAATTTTGSATTSTTSSGTSTTTTGSTATSSTIGSTTTTTGSTTSTTLATSTLNVVSGWNLVGNSVNAVLDVVSAFGDATKVATVWKWIAATTKWAFYTPILTDGGAAYASTKGYDFLTTIAGGEGFWVNAKQSFSAPLPTGSAKSSASFQGMGSGWSLIAIGDNKTAKGFNVSLSTTPPSAGDIPINLTTLWAWDATQTNWYFYAPSMEKNSTLAAYIQSKNYLDFGTKKLDPSMGFWVNIP